MHERQSVTVFVACPMMQCAPNLFPCSGTDMLTEHPLLSEPSSVSFYNWMSNAVSSRTGAAVQESPVNRSQHNSLQTGETTWASFIRQVILINAHIHLFKMYV